MTFTGSVAHVALAGEIDLSTAPQLTGLIHELVGAGRVSDVVLDLHELSFCDVRGLTAVLEAHHRVHRAGGHLTVTGVSGVVRRMATLTRLNSVLNLA